LFDNTAAAGVLVSAAAGSECDIYSEGSMVINGSFSNTLG
jgi:hypothetical protein